MKVSALKGRLRRLERAGVVNGQPDVRAKLQRREWSRADALAHLWRVDTDEMVHIGSEPSQRRVLGLLRAIDTTVPIMVTRGELPAALVGNLALDFHGWELAGITLFVKLQSSHVDECDLTEDETAIVMDPAWHRRLDALMTRAEAIWDHDAHLLARIVGEGPPCS